MPIYSTNARAHTRRNFRIHALVTMALSSVAPVAASAAEEVNVYSYREPELIQPLLSSFTGKTGIKINIIFAKEGLVERMSAEAKNSPADVLLTNESGILAQARAANVTQALKSEILNGAIPAGMRDPEGH